MKPVERPCIPEALLHEAEEAERRKDEALDRVLRTLAGELPVPDAFENAMRALIDADRAAVEELKRRQR